MYNYAAFPSAFQPLPITYYAITTPYYYSFARFSRRKRPWKNPFGREEWKKMGKVWSLTDEDGESCPCVWSKDEERFECETGRERDRFLSRVFIGLRSLSRKKRDNSDRDAAKADKFHGT